MTFVRPWLLSLLALIPVICFVLLIEARMRKKAFERFAEPELLERLSGEISGGRSFTKAVFFAAAVACLITALAGPQWGSHYEEITHKGVDIMVILDTSPSMLAQDVSPNRLERAKREVYDLLRVLKGDRLGLVAFSGAAFVQCPLTLDYAAIEMFLGELNTELIPVPGTDLGAAIDAAGKAFDYKATTDKVIILITDGEDNEGRGAAAAREAAAKGVGVYVYGIGSDQGAPVPAMGAAGGFMKDDNGSIVMSKLDEKGLRAIASLAGGKYVRSVTGDLDLDLLYFAGIKSSTTARELGTKKVQVFEERFQIFAVAAFLLLLIEQAVERRKGGPSS